MRLALLFPALASLLIVGCARHSIDCAMGEAHSDCAPGTAGSEKRLQQEQDAKALNAIDEARCHSFGKESSQYLDCRRRAAEARKSF
jgi:hypothetical protein